MISFKSFIGAIHDAILAANDSLMEKNTSLLDKYFINATSEDELQSSLDEALETSKALSAKKGVPSAEEYKKASSVFEKAKEALSSDNDNPSEAKAPGTLTPKSVVVEYPHQTENGIEFIEVHVPLITLAPLSMSQIEKATLSANFEMEIVDGNLQLNFANRNNTFKRKGKTTRGKLEITISPQESSEGMKQLVEGYEKILKSQIPH